MSKQELKITSDGSHTIYLPELDETYHSVHGAIQEAIHVFIKNGFYFFRNKRQLDILEIGFGTGLNAFLTLKEVNCKPIEVNYTGLEAFPLSVDLVEQLNYLQELKSNERESKLFKELHDCAWGIENKIMDNFYLSKISDHIQTFIPKKNFDLIYFDAFGPRVQPELWETEILLKMHQLLKLGGVLVTYCAKGSVKRSLKEVGFQIESLPGPPGKREMTRAIKS